MPSGPHATQKSTPHVKCREIHAADHNEVLQILERGFPERSRAYYALALQRLAKHDTPAGYPRYGYLLEVDGQPVGVVLVIASAMIVNGERRIRINVSSWYVDPEFRGFAAMLTSPLRKFKEATYLNVTPAPHTWTMLEALGYRRFTQGGMFAVAALSTRRLTARVRRVTSTVEATGGLSLSEAKLLEEHAGFGCISVVCEWKGQRYPFVFLASSTKFKSATLPYAHLFYCRDFESFVQFAGPLGRYLMRRGFPVVFTDTNGPVPGLIGRHVDWGARFYRGPNPPHLGDLSYTEWALFAGYEPAASKVSENAAAMEARSA